MTRLEQQIGAMAKSWPIFRVSHVNRKTKTARWTGTLAPQFARYDVEIIYEAGWPTVRVLRPVLVVQPGNPEGSLPHTYGAPENQRLCLYDPESDEWSPKKLIAETVVPWTIDWLSCYEFWVLTGEWRGGGRHVEAN